MTVSDHGASLVPSAGPLSPDTTALPPPLALAQPQFGEPPAGVEWHRVLAAVLRFKWLILAVTLLGGAAGVAATRFVRPEYLAQATIWIDETDRRAATDRGPIRPGHLLNPEAWVDLLRSYAVLDEVARDQRLFLAARRPADKTLLASLNVATEYRPGGYELTIDSVAQRYTLATDKGVELEQGALGDSIGRRQGLLWAPPWAAFGSARRVQFTLATLRDGARNLDEALDVRTDPDGNFLRLALRGADPVRITAIVNAVARRYVEVAGALKREKVTELTKILDRQLESARQGLTDAETSLERFGVRTITLPSDRAAPGVPHAQGARGTAADRDPVFMGFFDLGLERDQVKRDREALELAVAQARDSGVDASGLEAIAAVQTSPDLAAALKELVTKQTDLRTLKYQYTDAYPKVQRLRAEIATLERQTIPALARALAGELAAREAQLGRRIGAGASVLRQIPPRALEEARLRRAVTLAENVYTNLKERYEEARLADASTIPDVRILDSAVVPQRPVKNTAPRLLLVALVGSFGVAVVGAVLIDRADPRVRYPDQVSREMGLPILGALPHFKAPRDGARRPHESAAELVEALRGTCLNVVYAYGAAGPLLVAITSPGPGDGKSFLAANLARTFAEGGHRTLLIDADIRRGVLHRRLTARRRPGLTDCLRGEVPFEAIVQETAYPSLALMGCGTRVENAPELLGSEAMARLITRVRAAYDVILLDSPPLAGGVDPFILGTLTGNLLLVLRTGRSHRDMMAAKLEMLRRLPVRLLGAVLNDVPAGAGYGYYSYYLPGYEATDEYPARRKLVV